MNSHVTSKRCEIHSDVRVHVRPITEKNYMKKKKNTAQYAGKNNACSLCCIFTGFYYKFHACCNFYIFL